MIVKESQLKQSQHREDYPMFLSTAERQQLLQNKVARAVAAVQERKHDHKDCEHS